MAFKKINKSGGITIPVELRRGYDFTAGQGVEIVAEGGDLVLRKYAPRCLFCRSKEEVIEFKYKNVCKDCIKEMETSL